MPSTWKFLENPCLQTGYSSASDTLPVEFLPPESLPRRLQRWAGGSWVSTYPCLSSLECCFCLVGQSCPTLWDPKDCSTPASLSFTLSRNLLKLMSIELVHPTISSSLTSFSSCPQSFPASGSFPMSWLCIRWPTYWSFTAVGVVHMERLLIHFWISSLGKGVFSSHVLLFWGICLVLGRGEEIGEQNQTAWEGNSYVWDEGEWKPRGGPACCPRWASGGLDLLREGAQGYIYLAEPAVWFEIKF